MKLFSRAFTLIELLVVIAIIAILATILMANFNDARMSARDDTRKSDIKELQLAIELYKAQNGRYPVAGCGRGTNWVGFTSLHGNCAEYIVGLVPDYIAELPIDPNPPAASNGYLYRTDSTGSVYKVLAHDTVESKLVTSYDDEFARCPYMSGSGGCTAATPPSTSYAVYSLGAETW